MEMLSEETASSERKVYNRSNLFEDFVRNMETALRKALLK